MDLDHTLRFLETLEPTFETHQFYWSGQHPDGQRTQTYGTLEDMLPRLIARNQQGYGIFTTVNAMTPRYVDGLARRTKADVARVRAVVADWDDPNKPLVYRKLPIPPTMIVETSRRKYHLYWCVDEMPLEVYEQAQRGIAQVLGTDRSIVDLSREMRVPGFMHTKNWPRTSMVKLIHCDPTLRYTPLDILGAFPFDMKAAVPREKVEVPPLATLTHAVVQALWGPIQPSGGYNVPCPWEHEHTTRSSVSSTTYFPPSTEHGPQGYFKCMHSHCAGRCADEFDAWIAERVQAIKNPAAA